MTESPNFHKNISFWHGSSSPPLPFRWAHEGVKHFVKTLNYLFLGTEKIFTWSCKYTIAVMEYAWSFPPFIVINLLYHSRHVTRDVLGRPIKNRITY